MKHLGLFAGIGGFELAARWMGWETVAWCEWNEFCQKVLRYHFPAAEGHSDITKTDFTKYRNAIDIITGGFPCQPYSLAGKRKGTDDDRHLWPEMLRAIREIKPRWVVGENVPGLLNWSGGLVFEQVQTDLEAEGYEVQAYILPACSVNAPHKRERIWFVAYNSNARVESFRQGRENTIYESCPIANTEGFGFENRANSAREKREVFALEQIRHKEFWGKPLGFSWAPTDTQKTECEQSRNTRTGWNGLANICEPVANPNSRRQSSKEYREKKSGQSTETGGSGHWQDFPTQSPICDGNDGIPSRLDAITFPKWRNESIKAGGNAIVPQVALQIFKAIEQYNFNTF